MLDIRPNTIVILVDPFSKSALKGEVVMFDCAWAFDCKPDLATHKLNSARYELHRAGD